MINDAKLYECIYIFLYKYLFIYVKIVEKTAIKKNNLLFHFGI